MSRFEETIIKGVVDSNNSYDGSVSGYLGNGGVFTGTATEILNYGIVFINIYSDVASATDGVSIQQSSDGTNWDHADEYTLSAGATKNYSVNPHARYLRIVYTNGTSTQTAFRLQTILKGNSKPSSHRIQDAIIDEDDAELIKAVITGKVPGDGFINVVTTTDGNLSVSDNSSGLAIAKSDVTGHSFVHKFGAAPDFDKADGEITIWDGADDNTAWENMVYDYSLTADIDSVSSSDQTNDVGITLEIQGLDSNYDLVVQNATLDATDARTRVALSTSLIRVFRIKNTSATDLTGHVVVYPNTALTAGVPTDKSKIRAVVQPENNQTEMAVYTIPNGHTGYMRSWYATTAGASKDSNYIIRVKARKTGGVFQLKHKSALNDSATSYIRHEYVEPEVFSGKTDIEMTVEIPDGTATGATVAGGFDIVLVED